MYTVYRKSHSTPETLDDIFNILLWELKALTFGREPKVGEETKPMQEQEMGEFLNGQWEQTHKVALMQIKGDWAYYVEALGLWRWNLGRSSFHMLFAQSPGKLSGEYVLITKVSPVSLWVECD